MTGEFLMEGGGVMRIWWKEAIELSDVKGLVAKSVRRNLDCAAQTKFLAGLSLHENLPDFTPVEFCTC